MSKGAVPLSFREVHHSFADLFPMLVKTCREAVEMLTSHKTDLATHRHDGTLWMPDSRLRKWVDGRVAEKFLALSLSFSL